MRRIGLFERLDYDQQTGCWNWNGRLQPNGYAVMGYRGRIEYVHRVAAILWKRFDQSSGLWVLHKCDNRRCFNPAHLFFGDRSINMLDAAAKGRQNHARKTHCRYGPILTPVIQHVLNTLGGIGVPDYPDQMIAILKNILADFSSQAAVAAAPAAVPPPVQPAARTATAGPAASMPATAETVSQPAVASPAEIPAQAAPAGAEIPEDQDKADPVGPSVHEPTGEAQ